MLRLTQGLGAPPVNEPRGGRGQRDSDIGRNFIYDAGGWDVYAASDGRGACIVVNSRTLNEDEIENTWTTVGDDGVGYNAVCDCYCPGYKPHWEPVQIIGLGYPARDAAWSVSYSNRDPFKVCGGHGYRSDGECVACPPAPTCPTCPPPPKPVPPMLQPEESALDEWGTNLGWLLAGAVIAGGGYYAYKKGVFKKGYWKKLGRRRRR